MNDAIVEILAISQQQNPTGRTDGEGDYFRGLIAAMQSGDKTPGEAILDARNYADGRQDGHGGGAEGVHVH